MCVGGWGVRCSAALASARAAVRNRTRISNIELGNINPGFLGLVVLSRAMHFSLDGLAAEKFDLHKCLLEVEAG